MSRKGNIRKQVEHRKLIIYDLGEIDTHSHAYQLSITSTAPFRRKKRYAARLSSSREEYMLSIYLSLFVLNQLYAFLWANAPPLYGNLHIGQSPCGMRIENRFYYKGLALFSLESFTFK